MVDCLACGCGLNEFAIHRISSTMCPLPRDRADSVTADDTRRTGTEQGKQEEIEESAGRGWLGRV